MRVVTTGPGRALIPVALAMLTACAAAPPPEPVFFKGTSDSINWEVVDVGQIQSQDGRGTRWSYVVVLKAPPGEGLQLKHVERGISSAGEMIGATEVIPFERTLVGNSELRYPDEVDWRSVGSDPPAGGASSRPIATVEYRFVGQRGPAERVAIVMRVPLDRRVGALAARTPIPDPLPPTRFVADVTELVGIWRGQIRDDGSPYDIPLEVTVRADGSADIALNSPATRRFRASLSVGEGRVSYGAELDRGTFALHEREGERILAGRVSGRREDSPTPIGYTIQLRWQAP